MLECHYIILVLYKIRLSRKKFLGSFLLLALGFWLHYCTNHQRQMTRIKTWLKKQFENRFVANPFQEKSQGFTNLFPQKPKIERIATGFQFTEGPVWFAEQEYLLFSDIPANKIYKLSCDHNLTIFRESSNHANGLTRDKQGRLITCEHETRQITRTEKDGSITVLVDRFQSKKLNSPNDVVVKSDGFIYFTDPPYGIELKQQEQPIQGVYRLSPDGKEIILVAADFAKPNGLAFSPDEKQLYINDSEHHHLRIFDVQSDGNLTNSHVFYDMKTDKEGLPDGMKVDIEGHIYCTGGGGIWVFDSVGNHLGTIVTPEIAANCAWGDQDLRSLYITARTSLYRIRVNIPGVPNFLK